MWVIAYRQPTTNIHSVIGHIKKNIITWHFDRCLSIKPSAGIINSKSAFIKCGFWLLN